MALKWLFFLTFSLLLSNGLWAGSPKGPHAQCLLSSMNQLLELGDHRVQHGGLVTLKDGSYVEGTAHLGGVQPHYYFNRDHPEVRRLLEPLRRERVWSSLRSFFNVEPWEAISRIQTHLKKALPNRSYVDPNYVRINDYRTESGTYVELGDYIEGRCGVCRENALITHMALNEVGIPSQFYYVKETQATKVEDHAIVIIDVGGERWVVDTYNENFNGLRLSDLMSEEGFRPGDPVAPFGDANRSRPDPLRIIRENPYPTYILPDHP